MRFPARLVSRGGVYEFRGLAPGEYLVVVPSRMTTIPASVMVAGSVAAASLQTAPVVGGTAEPAGGL